MSGHRLATSFPALDLDAALAAVVATELSSWVMMAAGVGALAAVARPAVRRARAGTERTRARDRLLATIDGALAPYDDLRNQARDPRWRPPADDDTDPDRCRERRRVKEYMRACERVERLLGEETIDHMVVERRYGQRIENLLRNRVVREYVAAEPSDWERFLALADRLAHRRPHMRPWLDEVAPEARPGATAASRTPGRAARAGAASRHERSRARAA